MDIQLKQANVTEVAADLVIVNLFQGVTAPGGATGAVNRALGGAISDVIAAGDFTGKSGETLVLYPRRGTIPTGRVLVVGLGEAGKFDLRAARNAAAIAARKARDLGVKTATTIVHGAGIGGMEPAAAAAALVEGTRLGLYRFEGYRSKPPKDRKPDPETLTVLGLDPAHLAAVPGGDRPGGGGRLGRDTGARSGEHAGQPYDADHYCRTRGCTRRRDRAADRGAGPRRMQGPGHGHLHGRG